MNNKTAVIDSGVANLTSVMAALKRLNADAYVTSDLSEIDKAARIILPGVGAAAPAMSRLREKGLGETLSRGVKPLLGICLGMQLLFARSFEGIGEPVDCLGIFPQDIMPIKANAVLPVPHMGWNELHILQNDQRLLAHIKEGSYVYFVHSYAAAVNAATLATTDYGDVFTAVIGQGNFYGCQFHPERSGAVGSQILANFLTL